MKKTKVKKEVVGLTKELDQYEPEDGCFVGNPKAIRKERLNDQKGRLEKADLIWEEGDDDDD